ncbi:hypothetical protein FSC37_11860 [Piscinibacter aquaticus]|uniref:Uncharacterized protein n=1 Tax=Piscinibacter aquaticus TaxID=392597 RepID=A0A5C6U2W4_9BURK|nr:hypothetical protein FSC37_11860 [Piscinibacter aquaticus]
MIRAAVCLLALGAALASPVQAASDKLRIGIFGSGKGAGPLLTRAELRECPAIEAKVVEATPAAARDREQLEKEKAELIRQGDALKAELETLDRTSAEAIETYRAKVLARDKAIDEFDARSDAFNARVGALDADRAAFRQRCDNRRFDQADEAAIRKAK